MRDSTNPASRSTRRCLETDGCGIRSERSISLTDLSDDASRLRMARRLGSAIMAKADSTTGIYLFRYIPVKSCLGCSSNEVADSIEIGGGRRDYVRALQDVDILALAKAGLPNFLQRTRPAGG